jgi:EF hand
MMFIQGFGVYLIWPPRPFREFAEAYDCQPLMTHGSIFRWAVNKNGKISKQEYMRFMEAEFDWFDKNHNGELDVKEVTQSSLSVAHFTAAGK